MEGRDDEAIERFTSALMQDENSVLALLRLGELNLKKGRFHDMERFAARAVALDGKQSIGRIQLAVALAGLGKAGSGKRSIENQRSNFRLLLPQH